MPTQVQYGPADDTENLTDIRDELEEETEGIFDARHGHSGTEDNEEQRVNGCYQTRMLVVSRDKMGLSVCETQTRLFLKDGRG